MKATQVYSPLNSWTRKLARAGKQALTRDDIEWVRQKCVSPRTLRCRRDRISFLSTWFIACLARREVEEMTDVFCCDGVLNMTYLALNLSHYVNGVAKKHGEVSQAHVCRIQYRRHY